MLSVLALMEGGELARQEHVGQLSDAGPAHPPASSLRSTSAPLQWLRSLYPPEPSLRSSSVPLERGTNLGEKPSGLKSEV